MSSRWCCPSSSVLLLTLFPLSFYTSYGTSTKYGRVKENTTLPEIALPQGFARGINLISRNNRTYYGFKGIPYAEPPIGDLRFRAPVAARSWNGTLNANDDSMVCPQMKEDDVTFIGDEDCLYLNVYTPKLPTNDNATLLPVAVFIFGGKFRTGFNRYRRFDPAFLLDKDLVLVIPNFRLGPLGYLTTGDEVSPGNYGLKDIVLALKWIQENIKYLGGDASQVTLFGASSGAMSVSYLALSDTTNGLFHKLITQSGSALNIQLMAPVEVHVNRTMKLATHFGCPTNSSTLLINCLRGLSASELVDTYSIFHVWKSIPGFIWFPTTEPDVEGAFLTDTPANIFAAGKFRDIPSISLVTKTEGLATTLMLYEDEDLFEDFLTKVDFILPHLLGYSNAVDDETALTAALKSYYLNDLTTDRSVLLKNLTDLIGDSIFYYPEYSSTQQRIVSVKNPVYSTCFEYRGVFTFTYYFSGGSTNYSSDVVHADEGLYIFKKPYQSFGPPGSELSAFDWKMVDIMVQLWTSFMIDGTPIIPDNLNSSVTVWEPYSSSSRNYLRIGNGVNDTTLGIEHDLYGERMRFWEKLMATMSRDMQKREE